MFRFRDMGYSYFIPLWKADARCLVFETWESKQVMPHEAP
jgi:hypothetical protein